MRRYKKVRMSPRQLQSLINQDKEVEKEINMQHAVQDGIKKQRSGVYNVNTMQSRGSLHNKLLVLRESKKEHQQRIDKRRR